MYLCDVKTMQPLATAEIGEATKQAMVKMIKVEKHNELLLDMRNIFMSATRQWIANSSTLSYSK